MKKRGGSTSQRIYLVAPLSQPMMKNKVRFIKQQL